VVERLSNKDSDKVNEIVLIIGLVQRLLLFKSEQGNTSIKKNN
jgi:hypothetical protein